MFWVFYNMDRNTTEVNVDQKRFGSVYLISYLTEEETHTGL